jgi:hypothetical protein
MSTKENKESINTAIQPEGIPMPLVKLNRWILLIGVLIGLFLQQPLLTTVLFLLLLPTVIFGQRWSLIGIVGKMLFAKRIPTAEYEDRRLMRFNNTIASVLLGSAQLAFVLGFPIVGWTLSLMVAAAAGVALAGFCVGCFLYFQFKMLRYRIFG